MPFIGAPVARIAAAVAVAIAASALPSVAQTSPTPPPDQPSIKVGVTLFTDYTVQQQPKIKDADGNEVTLSSFNVTRSYINVTGNISKTVSFRITPDIARETGVGSSLNGSYTFRLKFAYAQWNLDNHMTPGTFARFGMHPTPWVEFIDSVYRYRFQGATLEDREGYLPSSDAGASFRYALPGNYGDVQASAFNGETYQRAEINDQKSIQLRGTLRPLPGQAALSGLRVTGFWDHDAYVKNEDRRRAIFGVTFEHRYVHAAYTYLASKDQTSAASPLVDGRSWSVFVTPIVGRGWEGLLRFDHVESNTATSQTKQRTIAGLAYWFPHQGNVSSALMLDVENVTFDHFSPVQPTQRKIAVHALVNF